MSELDELRLGESVPMHPIGESPEDIGHQLGHEVSMGYGVGRDWGSKWIGDHPYLSAGLGLAAVAGGLALAPEMALAGAGAGAAEALGVVETGEAVLSAGEIASALGGLGLSAGAA